MKPAALPNLPKVVVTAMIGKKQKPVHRYLAAMAIMAIGVVIAKHPVPALGEFGHYLADALGYMIHGLGSVPFVEGLMNGGGD